MEQTREAIDKMENLIDLNKKDLNDPFAAFWGLKKEAEMPDEQFIDDFPREE